MAAEIYWIPEAHAGRLAVMPRPRAGDWLEDEIKTLRVAGVDAIVSLLTPVEAAELGLADEPRLCQNRHIEFISFPIADMQVPASPAATIKLVRRICTLLQQGKGVAIHCRAGIGRSGLLAACVLVSQGLEVADAFAAISMARGTAVPETEEQRAWVAGVARVLRQP
ncbi:MAG: dual specificity protein phosphatase family protein [Chloroflexi bacterium]|nr:dual specificity protein phosphatase family protein [Chloroflexota bacterium]